MIELSPATQGALAAFVGGLLGRWLDVASLRRALVALTARVVALEAAIDVALFDPGRTNWREGHK